MLPPDLASKSEALWLLQEYERLRRDEFNEHLREILVAEAGVGRALVAAFGEKPDELPTWESVEGKPVSEEDRPSWIDEYKRVNQPPAAPID